MKFQWKYRTWYFGILIFIQFLNLWFHLFSLFESTYNIIYYIAYKRILVNYLQAPSLPTFFSLFKWEKNQICNFHNNFVNCIASNITHSEYVASLSMTKWNFFRLCVSFIQVLYFISVLLVNIMHCLSTSCCFSFFLRHCERYSSGIHVPVYLLSNMESIQYHNS